MYSAEWIYKPMVGLISVFLNLIFFVYAELEWMLGKAGAIETDIEENPRKHWGGKSNMVMSNVSDSEDEW